jgi:hypothetical protein
MDSYYYFSIASCEKFLLHALSHLGKGADRRIGALFRCAGLPQLAAEGLLLFCLIKKVTKKSRLGTDVGLARRNLNGGSTRARFCLK